MYGARPGANTNGAQSGPQQPFKFSILESCDRIKEEFNFLQAQYHSIKLDIEKLAQEKADMQRQFSSVYEMAYGIHGELLKQQEIAKRLSAILAQILPFLSAEHQQQVAAAVERAKQVSSADLVAPHGGAGPMANMFGGMTPNGPAGLNMAQLQQAAAVAGLPQFGAAGMLALSSLQAAAMQAQAMMAKGTPGADHQSSNASMAANNQAGINSMQSHAMNNAAHEEHKPFHHAMANNANRDRDRSRSVSPNGEHRSSSTDGGLPKRRRAAPDSQTDSVGSSRGDALDADNADAKSDVDLVVDDGEAGFATGRSDKQPATPRSDGSSMVDRPGSKFDSHMTAHARCPNSRLSRPRQAAPSARH